MGLSEKQRLYLEKVGLEPDAVEMLETEEAGGWMLVPFKPPVEISAAVAQAEQMFDGQKVEILDQSVWVDLEGREHFGPGESGYDRFELNA